MTAARGRTGRRCPDGSEQAAGLRLLEIYADLAQRGEHLLGGLLGGHAPRQWAHYPEDDAVDPRSGFQWFYHSHSPEDRPGSSEHGHIHLFARRTLWSRRLRSVGELKFGGLAEDSTQTVNTRHLLCIGFDAKGLPTSLFTVDSRTTGDLMLSAPTTSDILNRMTLNTGNQEVDAVIECVVRLCKEEIRSLLEERDNLLFSRHSRGLPCDYGVEILSARTIDMDEVINSRIQRRLLSQKMSNTISN